MQCLVSEKNKIQIGVFLRFVINKENAKWEERKREWPVGEVGSGKANRSGELWWECRYMFIFQLLEIISRSLGWFETPKRDDYNLQIFFCGLENQRVRFRGECNRVSRIEWILQEIKCLQYESVREKRTTTGKRRGFPSDLFESSKMLQVRMRTK